MDWLGNSQILTPIENHWNQMKNKLKEDISSLPKLKDALLKLWTQDLSNDYLAALRGLMPRRIIAIIKDGRHMTKYILIESIVFQNMLACCFIQKILVFNLF
jgi:hypothetical protein